MKKKKLLQKVAASPHNTSFGDFVTLIKASGFIERNISGSHYSFSRPGVPKVVNIQSKKGKAKAYQIDQFLQIIRTYGIEKEIMGSNE